MNKAWLTLSMGVVLSLTACAQMAENTRDTLYPRNGNTINVSDRNDLYNVQGLPNGMDSRLNNFGYVRHQKSPVAGGMNNVGTLPTLNRERVADLISKLCVQLPHVNDVATLVTDEEVLIAYATDTKNRFETADQVKKTALSVVPRYYHVYVADDPRMMKEIERFGRLDSNSRNIDQIIDTTIKEMLKYPQGRKLSDGENENGEMINEMNDHLDRDFHDGTPISKQKMSK
ncbi:sporulation lipoYhcN/YlaJ family protein [Anoxybacillus amylolyticus]|uniref:Sporulation lipoYhcN/YlaJ family protein n=2 Tax=Anoxybacteroides amylolyticum TaxID=294699 RepID=A0A167T327_9BACL|nr:YhcN/YlaJ family sporulation lipoprotein [Anoxybacillus amylolyticus]ANB59377.1 sporulation lipoYhcN/YlaJ family protein [Anoxybacillus amylolyticus]